MKADLTDLSMFENTLKTKSRLAESSIYVYVHDAAQFLVTNPDIDVKDCYNDFLEKMTIRKRSVHYRSALIAFINYKFANNSSLQESLIKGLITPMFRGDYAKDRQHFQLERLIEIVNGLKEEKHKVVALIQMITGVRAGDVFRLTYGKIMPEETKDGDVIRINFTGKGKKLNSVFIYDKALQQKIMEYIQLQSTMYKDYYFIDEPRHMKGRLVPLTEYTLLRKAYLAYWWDIKDSLLKNGIDPNAFSTHDFRRCFARRAWEMKPDVYRLQRLLNHKDPKVTLRYLERSGLETATFHKEMQQ